MSTENNKNFEWTDDLVADFAEWYRKQQGAPLKVEHWGKDLMKVYKDEVGEKRHPEYEILSFRDPCSDAQHRIVAYQSHHLTYEQWSQSWLNAKAPIHSVRRLSDGEVFELGKNVQHVEGHYSAVITEFYLPSDERGEMWFYCDGQKDTVKNLNNFVNLPTPKHLFTTEDGWDIYETSNVFLHGVDTNTWMPGMLHSSLFKKEDIWKWFSNEYNRDRYILMNKPALSINDVMFFFEATTDADTFLGAITEKVKEKL
jgi:hypothetical protein